MIRPEMYAKPPGMNIGWLLTMKNALRKTMKVQGFKVKRVGPCMHGCLNEIIFSDHSSEGIKIKKLALIQNISLIFTLFEET